MDQGAWKQFVLDFEKSNNAPVLVPLLKKTSFVSFSNNEAVVSCENLGMRIFLETRKEEMESFFSNLYQKEITITFTIKEKLKKETVEEAPLLKYETQLVDIIRKSGLQPKHTFDNYAVSTTNQIAYAAALAVADNPGETYNPLFIYGGVGVGKTHLVQAIANKILMKDGSKKIYYCSSEEFTNDLVGLIRMKNTENLRQKYRSLDVLLIDDIQFIAGKNSTQEEFFHTFNAVIKRGGQIILTSDRPPKDIQKLEDRLRSRFSGGLIIDIQLPDFELRTAILLIKAKERNIDIDIDAAKLIAEQVLDTRELEGRLLELYTKNLHNSERLSYSDVSADLSRKSVALKSKVTPQDVIKTVCSYYDLRPSQIKDQTRKDSIALPRQIIMYILRHILKLKLEEIAYILKRKDHTTILHGVEKITGRLLKNPSFKEEVDRIIQSLTSST
ncbi:MAG TPA: chromosomal replication initiator protein DnaA [Candidatus Nitrosocosmicus sp.]|nr:chromosomal replication initiator protein DnaA [Candidatus Nitrosocosmicus sp.]